MAYAFRTKIRLWRTGKFTPRRPLNLTLDQKADLVTRLEQSSRNTALHPEERLERARLAASLRLAYAKRSQRQDAGTPKTSAGGQNAMRNLIAEAYREYIAGQEQKGTIARIFDKVRNALSAITSALKGCCIANAGSIFTQVDE